MKAIQNGHTFRIYDNSMKVFNDLPAQNYLLCFDEQTGFYLSLYSEIELPEKVYGIHEEKVDKVLKSFNMFNRNLGVILSGDKGIGKSLFSKMLAIKAVNSGIPLIVVNQYKPGIAEYLNSIEQEVMILFDEFDKTFRNQRDTEGPQTEMLTLFDGLCQGKKLFVITCNYLSSLNDFLVNRPGRFHYHFRFEYPTDKEIREYMMDHIPKNQYKEIDDVISFARKTKINYDCLRAIAFELCLGGSFKDCIQDLNIINSGSQKFNITIELSNGIRHVCRNIAVDLFSDIDDYLIFQDQFTDDEIFEVHFIPADNHYDLKSGKCIINGENLKLNWCNDYKRADKEIKERYENCKVNRIIFEHAFNYNSYKYVL